MKHGQLYRIARTAPNRKLRGRLAAFVGWTDHRAGFVHRLPKARIKLFLGGEDYAINASYLTPIL